MSKLRIIGNAKKCIFKQYESLDQVIPGRASEQGQLANESSHKNQVFSYAELDDMCRNRNQE